MLSGHVTYCHFVFVLTTQQKVGHVCHFLAWCHFASVENVTCLGSIDGNLDSSNRTGKRQKMTNNWSKAILSATDQATAANNSWSHSQSLSFPSHFSSLLTICVASCNELWLYCCCKAIFYKFVLFPYLESSQPDWSELLKHFYPGRENLSECKDENWGASKRNGKGWHAFNLLLTLAVIWVDSPSSSSNHVNPFIWWSEPQSVYTQCSTSDQNCFIL